MQPRRDDPRLAGSADSDHLSPRDRVPRRKRKERLAPARSRDRRQPVRPRTERDNRRPRADWMSASSRPKVRRPLAHDDPPPERPTAMRPPSLAASADTGASKLPQSSGSCPIAGSATRSAPDETRSCPSRSTQTASGSAIGIASASSRRPLGPNAPSRGIDSVSCLSARKNIVHAFFQ